MDNGWMFEMILPFIAEYQRSIVQYPNIKPGEEFTGYKK
jgi:arylsulfatase